ncbi:Mth938-like domain-containing protein [Uliginosibacterium sp. H3]|uniref:Mth938-like domain-containing protein n=1 Tax=Uliginosibacterium silvisoli TaxID=3114758 RepID=A0ABU6K6R6_9RHOO|nr:Mth938-like domain-containing protein [Uliginosibacterium sp. H3]
MKLYRDDVEGLLLVTSYDADHVAINRERHEASLLVMPGHDVAPWAAGGFDALSEADFAQIRDLSPALVIVGTGGRQRFPKPVLLRPLIDAGIGFEIMDTGSACRTYNILAAEGRQVAAALMLD